VLKLIVTAGPVERGYARAEPVTPTRWMQCSDWPQVAPYNDQTPLRLQSCRTRLGSQPLLAGIKHLNRLEQVLARNEIVPPAHEGVVRNQRGDVVEGISSNLLIRSDNRWLTPPIDDCGVAGIVRGLLLDAAREDAESVTEASIAPLQLRTAEAVYVMNSLLGIRRVARLDDHRYAAVDDTPLIRRVHAACFTAEGVA
jgi:4-amino-4-deoxychorismate lyase